MTTNKKTNPLVLIVEDEMIIAADMSMQLSKVGYDVIGINTRGEDALKTLESNLPDVILMDIVLSGRMSGIDTALLILEKYQIPIIFLTSNTDDETFQRALMAKPFAFVSKPFQIKEIERSLKLALRRVDEMRATNTGFDASDDHVSSLDDRLFIRHKHQMVKVFIKDIIYIEADRNYSNIYTSNQNYFLTVSLGHLITQLPADIFVRVHRSFVINIEKIDAVSEQYEYVIMQSYQVPVARRMKDEVVKRLRLI
jgi:DNA-binding LytR/AlgR family response regulator